LECGGWTPLSYLECGGSTPLWYSIVPAVGRGAPRLSGLLAARRRRISTVKRIEDLLGMPIVTVQEGVRLGKVKGVEVDTAEGRIRYLHFDGERNRQDGVISWHAVRSVGGDAVTIESVSQAKDTIPPAERDGLSPQVGDRPVVTESGTRLGTVTSYELDEVTGHIQKYRIGAHNLLERLTGREIEFPHSAIRTFGKDAIIVADEVAA
jgi:sporulation protein YlmC with PRC-barrel domain